MHEENENLRHELTEHIFYQLSSLPSLSSLSEEEIDALSSYTIAIFDEESTLEEFEAACSTKLPEFLGDDTETFVNALHLFLEQKSEQSAQNSIDSQIEEETDLGNVEAANNVDEPIEFRFAHVDPSVLQNAPAAEIDEQDTTRSKRRIDEDAGTDDYGKRDQYGNGYDRNSRPVHDNSMYPHNKKQRLQRDSGASYQSSREYNNHSYQSSHNHDRYPSASTQNQVTFDTRDNAPYPYSVPSARTSSSYPETAGKSPNVTSTNPSGYNQPSTSYASSRAGPLPRGPLGPVSQSNQYAPTSQMPSESSNAVDLSIYQVKIQRPPVSKPFTPLRSAPTTLPRPPPSTASKPVSLSPAASHRPNQRFDSASTTHTLNIPPKSSSPQVSHSRDISRPSSTPLPSPKHPTVHQSPPPCPPTAASVAKNIHLTRLKEKMLQKRRLQFMELLDTFQKAKQNMAEDEIRSMVIKLQSMRENLEVAQKEITPPIIEPPSALDTKSSLHQSSLHPGIETSTASKSPTEKSRITPPGATNQELTTDFVLMKSSPTAVTSPESLPDSPPLTQPIPSPSNAASSSISPTPIFHSAPIRGRGGFRGRGEIRGRGTIRGRGGHPHGQGRGRGASHIAIGSPPNFAPALQPANPATQRNPLLLLRQIPPSFQNEDKLKALYSPFGGVKNVDFLADRTSALVKFSTRKEAEMAKLRGEINTIKISFYGEDE